MAKRTTSKTAAPRSRKPGKPAAQTVPAPPSAAQELALELGKLALEKKALNVLALDVRGLTSYAEFFVLVTAESDPQLMAVADHLEAQMKAKGVRPLSIEGQQSGRWVLLDYGDVVVHVFFGDTREFYDLEGLWADAPRTVIAD